MENFVFAYPTKNYFGKEAAKQALNAELPKYGKNVLLAYGGGSIKRNGIYDEVMALLQEQGKEVTEFQGIMSNPTYAKVQEGAKLCRDHKIDFILAVGGGSVSDCCKAVSAQAKLTSDLYDYEYQEKKIPQDGIPMGVIVTAAGTGSEQNAGAVITYEEKNWKGSSLGYASIVCRVGSVLHKDRAAETGPLGCVRYAFPLHGDVSWHAAPAESLRPHERSRHALRH